MSNEIKLTSNWDKVFPKSNKVSHSKVTFKNRFGIFIAADLYEPKIIKEKLPALAVSGPFGAVKEQSSGLYAREMAERGFLTLAFDPSFTGESGGEVRDVASPDINTEDFQAAVDLLWNHEKVDSNKIGIIGICGWGGLALNAAAIDTRIKATVVSTMYDMTRIAAKGYFDSVDEEQRYELKENLNDQRNLDFQSNTYERAGGVVDPVPEDALDFVKDYHDYYKTERGYHERSVNSNKGWAITSSLSYMNGKLLAYSSEIRSAVLVIHGENAHSRYFGEDAFKTLKGDNKKLMIIPGASHTDLYDQKDIIPFDELESFFNTYLEV
ncbi:alpha/beta hydrolase [Lactococcus lactis]|uniref:alpha/beta hydrolase n=1 Tax=Lactococcus lactis TaxID=1358 RepID=UPI0015D4FA11|nr:alpha/beta hydrolase [Lactococcus lactis]GFO79135.1 alpha/beta hydrolase [Lactococcus lactis]